jgi:hypothetical protein
VAGPAETSILFLVIHPELFILFIQVNFFPFVALFFFFLPLILSIEIISSGECHTTHIRVQLNRSCTAIPIIQEYTIDIVTAYTWH